MKLVWTSSGTLIVFVVVSLRWQGQGSKRRKKNTIMSFMTLTFMPVYRVKQYILEQCKNYIFKPYVFS